MPTTKLLKGSRFEVVVTVVPYFRGLAKKGHSLIRQNNGPALF